MPKNLATSYETDFVMNKTRDHLRAMHAGEPEEPSLLDYLALGAGSVEVVPVSPGHDVLLPLAARLKDVDLIITGSRAEQGAGSGLLPYTLARRLGRPIVANVLEARVENGEVQIRQFLNKGKRRGVAAPLPVVLVVHPLAPVEIRYAYARRSAGRIVEAEPTNGPSEPDISATWSFAAVSRRPVILKAENKMAGHARLMSAIGSEAKGGTVAIEGSPVDKAQVMLSFLREHRLVDF
jgi:electron transfer flavoprotein beta subunit